MAETLIQDIRDFHDVIRLLGEHPEWQADLRRVLLTSDLLAMPEQMSRLAEHVRELATAQIRTDQRLETLAKQGTVLTEQGVMLTKQVAVLTERVSALTEQMTVLTQRVSALEDQGVMLTKQMTVLTQRVSALTEQVSALTNTTQSLGDDVAKLKGMGLETRLRLSGSPFFGVVLRKPQVLSRNEVTDLLDDAEDRGVLTPIELREVQLADLIVHGLRRYDRASAYLVVEVSWTVDTNDVRRAADRANFLAKTGAIAVPVVVGEKIGALAAELAQTLQVWQMTDEEVVPPSA